MKHTRRATTCLQPSSTSPAPPSDSAFRSATSARLVAEKRIPVHRGGPHLHFDPEELYAWIDEHRRPRAQELVALSSEKLDRAPRARGDGEPGVGGEQECSRAP